MMSFGAGAVPYYSLLLCGDWFWEGERGRERKIKALIIELTQLLFGLFEREREKKKDRACFFSPAAYACKVLNKKTLSLFISFSSATTILNEAFSIPASQTREGCSSCQQPPRSSRNERKEEEEEENKAFETFRILLFSYSTFFSYCFVPSHAGVLGKGSERKIQIKI